MNPNSRFARMSPDAIRGLGKLAYRCRAYKGARAYERLARLWSRRRGEDAAEGTERPGMPCYICGRHFAPENDNQRQAQLCQPCIWGR